MSISCPGCKSMKCVKYIGTDWICIDCNTYYVLKSEMWLPYKLRPQNITCFACKKQFSFPQVSESNAQCPNCLTITMKKDGPIGVFL